MINDYTINIKKDIYHIHIKTYAIKGGTVHLYILERKKIEKY